MKKRRQLFVANSALRSWLCTNLPSRVSPTYSNVRVRKKLVQILDHCGNRFAPEECPRSIPLGLTWTLHGRLFGSLALHGLSDIGWQTNGSWGYLGDLDTESGQTLEGSFSAVSKPNLQVKAHVKALAEIYTVYSVAPRCTAFGF